MEFTGMNVPVEEAARLMNKDKLFIRNAMIQGILPIGTALKKEGCTRYDFYISPKLLYEFTGAVYEKALKKADPQGTSAH